MNNPNAAGEKIAERDGVGKVVFEEIHITKIGKTNTRKSLILQNEEF